MPGSGTFSVEAVLGSVIPPTGKVLIANNGAYGDRMVQIARRLKIPVVELKQPEVEPADVERIEHSLQADQEVTHVAIVHCETTTGMLNPITEVGEVAKRHGKVFIVDAMSSFGGIPMTMEEVHADFLISSANKCIQGVPGFGFVIMQKAGIEATRGWARSLSLDLFDQWREMEEKGGKWRYTSPTHVVCAFAQALRELQAEGGVPARHARYSENHRRLVTGMEQLGFRTLLTPEWQSPIITSFLFPDDSRFEFDEFYDRLKRRRYVIYPGKVSQAETFRIGNIGNVFPEDMDDLVSQVGEVVNEMGVRLAAPAAVN
jgi:2-aminoethylphosphonate-pyruvate transaminase